MLIPIIPRNLQPVFQTGPVIFDTDSTTNVLARPPICEHDIEGSFSWLSLPRPVVARAECNASFGSIPARVALHNLYPHTNVAVVRLSPKAADYQMI